MLIISTTHFPSLVFTFPTLILKICFLAWEVPITLSGRWFQSVMDLYTASISQCLFFVIWFSFSNNDWPFLSSLVSVTYPLLLSMASHSRAHPCVLSSYAVPYFYFSFLQYALWNVVPSRLFEPCNLSDQPSLNNFIRWCPNICNS